jgi:hypothetical protein
MDRDMEPNSDLFRRSTMGRSSISRLLAVGGLMVLLWLAIGWAVSLP